MRKQGGGDSRVTERPLKGSARGSASGVEGARRAGWALGRGKPWARGGWELQGKVCVYSFHADKTHPHALLTQFPRLPWGGGSHACSKSCTLKLCLADIPCTF